MIVPVKEFLVNGRLGQRAYLYAVGGRKQGPSYALGEVSASTNRYYPYALSLLPTLPTAAVLSPSARSPLIFAWTTSDEPVRSPETCQEVATFVALMQTTIGQAHEQLRYLLTSRAARQEDGWLALVDERAPFVWGRAPEAEDTIGFCRAERGQVRVDSYEPMPAYRLITRSGIFSLPTLLHQRLLERLKQGGE